LNNENWVLYCFLWGNIQEISNQKKQKTNKLKKTIFKLPEKTDSIRAIFFVCDIYSFS